MCNNTHDRRLTTQRRLRASDVLTAVAASTRPGLSQWAGSPCIWLFCHFLVCWSYPGRRAYLAAVRLPAAAGSRPAVGCLSSLCSSSVCLCVCVGVYGCVPVQQSVVCVRVGLCAWSAPTAQLGRPGQPVATASDALSAELGVGDLRQAGMIDRGA